MHNIVLCWPEEPQCKFSAHNCKCKGEKETEELQLCQCWIKLWESSGCSCQTDGLACTDLCLCTECKNLLADNLHFEMPECGPDGDEIDRDSVEDNGSEDELL